MKIKRSLLFWAMGNKTNIKAVSLLLVLKRNLGKTSSLCHASQNKIASCCGVSPSTIKMYMPVWLRLGLVEWRGKNKDVFVVNKMSAKTSHRNVDLSRLDMSSFWKVYKSLRSFLFLIILSCKDLVKRMIRTATDSDDLSEVKKARKFCNRYAKREKDKDFEYNEFGISLRKIGQKLGFCKRTAESIVDFAVKRRWCRKFNNYDWTFMPGVNKMYVEGFTFTTMNYGFVIKANTYSLNRNICMALIGSNF